jgi:type IV pilus assembly protein PilE
MTKCLDLSHATPTRVVSSQVEAGFSLLELMIVVAIVGILTAIALPNYSSYIQRGHRASARATLMEANQFMERYYSTNNRYSVNADGTGSPTLPARLATSPVETPMYDVAVSAVGLNSFTLTATPRNAVSSCGNLTLDNTGVKGISNPANPSASDIATCWR